MNANTRVEGGIVVGFNEQKARIVPSVGGKFSSLARLVLAGFSVPPAICLTTEAASIVFNDAAYGPLIRSLIESQHRQSYGQSIEIGNEIRKRIRAVSVPSLIEDILRERLSDLIFPLIVRSSASQEDSSTRSFAGVFDSVLGINSVEETFDAIKECWASLFSERALAYSRENPSIFEDYKMAVICQTMLTPRVSGVAFTWDPLHGESMFTINASWGLPSLLVGGEIIPDLYELGDDGKIIQRRVGSKRQLTEFKNGVLKTRPSTKSERERSCLSDWELAEIYQCGKKIESIFGSPQDIEWAIQDDRLHILQSRAITRTADVRTGVSEVLI